MSKRLTFYPSMRTGLRLFSGSTPDCSADSPSAVQKVRSLPINRVKRSERSAAEAPLWGDASGRAELDAPGNRPYYQVGSTDHAGDDAGWTEVVIPGGLPVLGNLGGCFATTILYSSSDCDSAAPKNGFDRKDFSGACHQDNRTSRSTALSEMSKFSCPTNNEVT